MASFLQTRVDWWLETTTTTSFYMNKTGLIHVRRCNWTPSQRQKEDSRLQKALFLCVTVLIQQLKLVEKNRDSIEIVTKSTKVEWIPQISREFQMTGDKTGCSTSPCFIGYTTLTIQLYNKIRLNFHLCLQHTIQVYNLFFYSSYE